MKQHVYAVQEMQKASLKTLERAEKEVARAGAPEYTRRYHEGRVEAVNAIRKDLAPLVLAPDTLDEGTVKKLASQWRTKSLLLLQQAFKAEADKRYESRHALGQQYTYALAAIELERLLRGAPQVAVAPAIQAAS